MSKDNYTFYDYVKAAFRWKVNLPLLGYFPMNKLILAGFLILGFGHRGFWFLGLSYETAYLLLLAGSERFQNLVRAVDQEKARVNWTRSEADILAGLDESAKRRYNMLRKTCMEIEHPGASQTFFSSVEDLKIDGLNQLLRIFVNLLESEKNIVDVINKTKPIDLQRDIETLQAKLKLEKEDTPIYKSIKGTVEIQEKRLENLKKSMESLKVIDAELNRIESQVSLIKEETALQKNPEILSTRLDGVVQSLQGTTQWMNENAALFSILDEDSTQSNLLPRTRTKLNE